MAEGEPPPANGVDEDNASYWGYLFNRDKTPTDRLDRLLRGIAWCISSNFEKTDNNDLSPSQMAAFYRTVGGDYDPLFLDMPSSSIAFIYQNLGCAHSLQPDSQSSGHTAPSVPYLKLRGYVTWQSIQLLLGPEEHVPFLQNALKTFEVVDPIDGTLFPRTLPKEAFPEKPDPTMVSWHESVSQRLRVEAQDAQEQAVVRRVPTDGADERGHAVAYFANPHYRNKDGRPAIVRQASTVQGKVLQGGKVVARNVLDILDPNLFGKRRPTPERQHSGDRWDNHRSHSRTDEHHRGSHTSAPRSHHAPPRAARRTSSSDASSKSEDERPSRRPSGQKSARRRSHESPRARSRGNDRIRDHPHRQRSSRSSSLRRSRPAVDPYHSDGFNPSRSPPFAAKVSNGQQQSAIPPHMQAHYANVHFASQPGSRSSSRPGSKTGSRPSSAYGTGRQRATTFQAVPVQSEPHASEEPVRRVSTPVQSSASGEQKPPTSNVEQNPTSVDMERKPSSRERQDSPPGHPTLVGGVRGRAYPNETPWRCD